MISSPNRPSDGQLTEKHARFLKQLNDTPDLQSALVDRIRADKLSSEDTGNLGKSTKEEPGQAKSIARAARTDHLEQFFQDTFDPNADFLASQDSSAASSRLSPHAQRVLDFLPSLAGIDPAQIAHPEIRQIQDALTSLRMAVDGMLKCCREQLGE